VQGRLQYFEPAKVNDKTVVKPPVEGVEVGIPRWNPNLVGYVVSRQAVVILSCQKSNGADVGLV
jgi:hypothetical protein